MSDQQFEQFEICELSDFETEEIPEEILVEYEVSFIFPLFLRPGNFQFAFLGREPGNFNRRRYT